MFRLCLQDILATTCLSKSVKALEAFSVAVLKPRAMSCFNDVVSAVSTSGSDASVTALSSRAYSDYNQSSSLSSSMPDSSESPKTSFMNPASVSNFSLPLALINSAWVT